MISFPTLITVLGAAALANLAFAIVDKIEGRS